VGLQGKEKSLMISLFISIQYWHVMDGQTCCNSIRCAILPASEQTKQKQCGTEKWCDQRLV